MVFFYTNNCSINQNKLYRVESTTQMQITTAIIPPWLDWRGNYNNSQHPHGNKRPQQKFQKPPVVSRTSAPSSLSNDCFVFIMVTLLLITCIISTIIMSKIITISTPGVNITSKVTNLLNTFSIPNFPTVNNPVPKYTPMISFLRQNKPQHQSRRQLYEFVTPNIRLCSESKLLDNCPYIMETGNGTSNSVDTSSLYDGTCPSKLQQMITDSWCDTGEKEVCCGISSDDCCKLSKSYLALFFLLAMVLLSPFFIIVICAYGRCCILYPKLWNAKSNRGCGRPRLSSAAPDTSKRALVELPETAVVEGAVVPFCDAAAVIIEEQPNSK